MKWVIFLPNTGIWIRTRLMKCGEDYPHHMYRLLKEKKKKAGFKVGNYQNFRNYVYWLSHLGLIEFVREEPSSSPVLLSNRRYYRLTAKGRSLQSLEAWRNPRKYLYRESWKKSH